MWEPGMRMFRVQLTRNGEEAGTFVLPAFDVDGAVARAKAIAAETKEEIPDYDNPFDNMEGLDAWVGSIG